MLGARTLFVNPPLVGGIAFTRQGRCQEREEVLGTTKPPYTLALAAALYRDRGCEVRLVDLTATHQSIEGLIARLDAERFTPTLIVFPSTTPTLDADAVAMAKLKARYGAPLFSFGPHVSCTPRESMDRAPAVDGMFVGEPEDGLLALASLESLDAAHRHPEPDVPSRWPDRAAPRARLVRRVPARAVPGVGSPRSLAVPSPARRSVVRHHRDARAAARTRAISASRQSTRATSSGRRMRRRSSTRSSRATASTASGSSISGATRSRSTSRASARSARSSSRETCRSSGSATRGPTT